MMNVDVRRMRHDETEAVLDMWDRAIGEHPGGDAMTSEESAAVRDLLVRAATGEEAVCLVATLESGIVGFVYAVVHAGDDPLPGSDGVIEQCYVAPGVRRTGIGTALVSQVMCWLRHRGSDPISLETWLDDDAVTSFWGALGFEPESIRMASYVDQASAPGN